MSTSRAENLIINSPYEESTSHGKIHEPEPAEKIDRRLNPPYMGSPPGAKTEDRNECDVGYELRLPEAPFEKFSGTVSLPKELE